MSHSQSYSINLFILTRAWLSLWDKHMTTGRINQVSVHNHRFFQKRKDPAMGRWPRVRRRQWSLVLFLVPEDWNLWIFKCLPLFRRTPLNEQRVGRWDCLIGLSLPSSKSSFLGLKIQKSYQEAVNAKNRSHCNARSKPRQSGQRGDSLVISELDPSVWVESNGRGVNP